MEFDGRHMEQPAENLEHEAEELNEQAAEQKTRAARLEQALTALEQDTEVSRILAHREQALDMERQDLETRREEAIAALERLREEMEQLTAENENSSASLDALRELGENVDAGCSIVEERQRWLEECRVRLERLAAVLGEDFESIGDFSAERASKKETGTEAAPEEEQKESPRAAEGAEDGTDPGPDSCSAPVPDGSPDTPAEPLHPMSERETAAPWRIVSTSVTESAVEANFRYGEGGGRQIFVADAGQMMQSGRLSEVLTCTLTLSDTGAARMQAVHQDDENREQDIRNAMAGSGSGARAVDRRPMDPSEVRQLENDTDFDAGRSMPAGDWADAHTAADLRQLDASIPPETVLPRAMDSAAAQGREDRRHQLSDQEDTGGMYHPDGVRPPRELRNGEILYQVRPVRPEPDRKVSCYFTDEATVGNCLDELGRFDADLLLRKLQIAPSYDKAGNLCRTYTLKAYRYWDGQPAGAGGAPKSGGAEDGEERVRERVPWER